MPGTKLNVSFKTPSGEKIELECDVKWVRHISNMPFGVKHHMGLEIINPSIKYREFIKSLNRFHSSISFAGSA
jgi:hypothetical protein